MSISISNIKYDPTYWVVDNDTTLTISFDVDMACDNPGDILLPFFSFEIDLEDDQGNVVSMIDDDPTGEETGEDETDDSTTLKIGKAYGSGAVDAGGHGHVDYAWFDPPIPDGGARPYITVKGTCEEIKKVGHCTGITKVIIFVPVDGDTYGPEIPICHACFRGCHD